MSLDKFIGKAKKRKKTFEENSSVDNNEKLISTQKSTNIMNTELDEQEIQKNSIVTSRETISDYSILQEEKDPLLESKKREKGNALTTMTFTYSDILEIARFHPLYNNYLHDTIWILKDESVIDPQQYLELKFGIPKSFIQILLTEAQKIANSDKIDL